MEEHPTGGTRTGHSITHACHWKRKEKQLDAGKTNPLVRQPVAGAVDSPRRHQVTPNSTVPPSADQFIPYLDTGGADLTAHQGRQRSMPDRLSPQEIAHGLDGNWTSAGKRELESPENPNPHRFKSAFDDTPPSSPFEWWVPDDDSVEHVDIAQIAETAVPDATTTTTATATATTTTTTTTTVLHEPDDFLDSILRSEDELIVESSPAFDMEPDQSGTIAHTVPVQNPEPLAKRANAFIRAIRKGMSSWEQKFSGAENWTQAKLVAASTLDWIVQCFTQASQTRDGTHVIADLTHVLSTYPSPIFSAHVRAAALDRTDYPSLRACLVAGSMSSNWTSWKQARHLALTNAPLGAEGGVPSKKEIAVLLILMDAELAYSSHELNIQAWEVLEKHLTDVYERLPEARTVEMCEALLSAIASPRDISPKFFENFALRDWQSASPWQQAVKSDYKLRLLAPPITSSACDPQDTTALESHLAQTRLDLSNIEVHASALGWQRPEFIRNLAVFLKAKVFESKKVVVDGFNFRNSAVLRVIAHALNLDQDQSLKDFIRHALAPEFDALKDKQ
jgi:hypothetical protein